MIFRKQPEMHHWRSSSQKTLSDRNCKEIQNCDKLYFIMKHNSLKTMKEKVSSSNNLQLPKTKNNVFYSKKTNTSPQVQRVPVEMNEIFQNNKDAKLANYLIQMHKDNVRSSTLNTAQSQRNLVIGSRDVSYRQDILQKDQTLNQLIFSPHLPNDAHQEPLIKVNNESQQKHERRQSVINTIQNLAQYTADPQQTNHHFNDFDILQSFSKQNERKPQRKNDDLQYLLSNQQALQSQKIITQKTSYAQSPIRFSSIDLPNGANDLLLKNAHSHIENLDRILLNNESSSGTIGNQPDMGSLERKKELQEAIKTVNKFMPTDIKHLEHIIQYTQPNQITQHGNKLCQRKQCIEGYHSNQTTQKKQLQSPNNQVGHDDDTDDKNKEEDVSFEEECENFMRNLQKYYEKFIKNENAFMQKSYLESNMFSNKRRTIENLIRIKQEEKGIIKETSEQTEIDKDQIQDARLDLIKWLMGKDEDSKEEKAKKESQEQNPYAELFGAYDFRYYNSKLPQPQKESLGKPSGRKQVQLLNEWFECMMEQYVYNQKQFLEREDQRKKAFYFSKVILTICIRDLVRQVSVHCIERGAFMEKVLNIYLSIYEAELRTHLFDIDLQKEKHIEQIKVIREQNRHQINSFEKLIDSLNVKIKEVQQQRDKYQQDLESMKETLLKYQENQVYSHYSTNKQSTKKYGGIVSKFPDDPNKKYHKSPRPGAKESTTPNIKIRKPHVSEPIDKNSDEDIVDSDGSKNLQMTKSKVDNLGEQKGSIQRQRVYNKKDKVKIRIADSSDSLHTEDDQTVRTSKRRKQSFSESKSSQDFNEDENHSFSSPKDKKKNVHFNKKRDTFKKRQKFAKTYQDQEHELRADEVVSEFDKDTDPDFQIKEQDSEIIKNTINLLVDQQDEEEKENQAFIINKSIEHGIIQDEDMSQDEHNYEIKRPVATDNDSLTDSLNQIEKEQMIRLISSLSEITKQLYDNKGEQLGQKELLKALVETILKNNKQTLMKLLNRVSETDNFATQKIFEDAPQEQQAPNIQLADLLKPNNITNTGFIQLAKRRQSNLSKIQKIVKDGYNKENKEPNQQSQNIREAAIQTEDFHFIDYDSLSIEIGEIYMFERVSKKLRKLIVEIDPITGNKIYKQFEFSFKGMKDDFLVQLKSSIAKKKQAEFKYKIDIKNKHYEINRANRLLKSLLEKITEMELQIQTMELRSSQLQLHQSINQISNEAIELENIGFKNGYRKGFENGRNAGYFKGYNEGRHFGHQIGFQDGVKEGWNFGFDDGFKHGIRRIFKDCRDLGINIDQLDLMEYINKEEQSYGIKKFAFDKLFKIISRNEKLQQAYKIHDKFMMYNDKKKKHFAKMGRKNVIKMVTQLYSQIIQSWHQNNQQPNFIGILEYMYDEFTKKYGNVKLAEKKILQILGSTYYHIESHPKITFFGMCLHLSKRGFSNEILYFYLSTKDKIHSSNVGINIKQDDKSDIDIVPYLKAMDGIKVVLEDKIPLEAYGRIKQEVERFTITKERAKVVDLDKLLELMLFESYFMTYGEIMMLVEAFDVEKFRVDADGQQRYIDLERKEFISIMEKKRMEQIQRAVWNIQSTIEQENTWVLRIVTSNDKLEEIQQSVKVTIDGLYLGQKWKNLKFLDSKDQWLNRIARLEKSIQIISPQSIVFAALIYQEILQSFYTKRKELYGDGKDDEDEVDLLELGNYQHSSPDQNDKELTASASIPIQKYGTNKRITNKLTFTANSLPSSTIGQAVTTQNNMDTSNSQEFYEDAPGGTNELILRGLSQIKSMPFVKDAKEQHTPLNNTHKKLTMENSSGGGKNLQMQTTLTKRKASNRTQRKLLD